MAWFDGLTPDGKDFAIMMAVVSTATENLTLASNKAANAAADAEAALAAVKLLQTWNVSSAESQEVINLTSNAVNALHLAITRCQEAVVAANRLLGV